MKPWPSLAAWAALAACAPGPLAPEGERSPREVRVEVVPDVPSDALLVAVAFSRDGAVGLAVGGRGERDSGEVLRTTDEGRTWTVVDTPSRGRLYDVAFTDELGDGEARTPRAVVAVGFDGQILRSADDGATWELVRSGDGWLAGVAFVDGRRGHAIGAHGERAIWLTTSDGGVTWSPGPALSTPSFLRGIAFRDPRHGVLVGDEGTLLVTEDGGVSWRADESGGGYLRGSDFTPAGTARVVGGPGVLLRREAGSERWERLPFPSREKLNAVRFVDEARGWVTTMEGTLWATDDGGASWAAVYRSGGRHLVDMIAPTPDRPGLVVGGAGLVLRMTVER